MLNELLFYSIPVRTTQSIWFRITVLLLIAAAINALWFRARMRASGNSWDTERLVWEAHDNEVLETPPFSKMSGESK